MRCLKCKTKEHRPDGAVTFNYGRVMVDRLYPQDKRVELYCLRCGKRWFVKNNEGNSFSVWLRRIESQHRRNYGIFS